MTFTATPEQLTHFTAVRKEAQAELDVARAAMNLLAGKGRTSGKAFRDAAEDVEFWGNKLANAEAFLSHELGR